MKSGSRVVEGYLFLLACIYSDFFVENIFNDFLTTLLNYHHKLVNLQLPLHPLHFFMCGLYSNSYTL